MKTARIRTLIAGFFIATFIIISCQKSKISDQSNAKPESTEVTGAYKPGVLLANGSVLSGGVTLTAPGQVNTNQSFAITAAIDCGRVAIERGYILAEDNSTKIYKDLSCSTQNLQWESVVNFQCYTSDASWNSSFTEAGSYVFRTMHNSSDGNCDGLGGSDNTGACSFNGNEFYCFTIEAINACETSFTGEAISCGTQREAVYTFKSKDALEGFKIQGGLTNFTGADADVTITGGSNIEKSQWTVGSSSNRVIEVEGNIGACETITIRIKWNSTNSGGIITGSWSVSAGGIDVAPVVAGLTCQ